jgi:hypothetical protein
MNKMNRLTRLPQVLVNYVWEYDERNKVLFKNCVDELEIYFNHSRLKDRLYGDVHLYNIYLEIHTFRKRYNFSLYDNGMEHELLSFSTYVFARITTFGDQVTNNNLCPYNLRKAHVHINTENNIIEAQSV